MVTYNISSLYMHILYAETSTEDPLEQTEEFYNVVLNEERYFPSLAFTLSTDKDSHESVLIITQRQLAKHPLLAWCLVYTSL